MTLTSTMTITAGTLDTSASNCSSGPCIVVGGSWNNTGGTFYPNASTVTFNATTAAKSLNPTARTSVMYR